MEFILLNFQGCGKGIIVRPCKVLIQSLHHVEKAANAAMQLIANQPRNTSSRPNQKTLKLGPHLTSFGVQRKSGYPPPNTRNPGMRVLPRSLMTCPEGCAILPTEGSGACRPRSQPVCICTSPACSGIHLGVPTYRTEETPWEPPC